MSKILCIGLNKTGTSSLHGALKILGFKSFHSSTVENNQAVKRAIREGKPMFQYLKGDFDAYCDFEDLTWNFELADKNYPGSKFIVTHRDLSSWLRSRTAHVKRNIFNKQRGKYRGTWLQIDPESWTRDWYLHKEKVQKYFREQEHRVLMLDVCAGEGYEKLCPFLDKPFVNAPFPWRNKR